MPIYEFYCVDCHTVFNFLSRTVNTTKRPACPRCGRPELERRISRFAVARRRAESDEPGGRDDLPPGFDEEKMERAMEALADEAEGLDEENPRQMARMMRKLFDTTGLPLGPNMEEAIRRMEAGEDPDKIEEELGDLLDQEDPFSGEPGQASPKGAARGGGHTLRAMSRKLRPPRVDETLYDL
ncbi:MAG: zinc ribbon domain-containing protein [Thermoguttaceae bacterium]|nr:zinc ribbon domain-containing protein [Thermoguttaceae bacterium]